MMQLQNPKQTKVLLVTLAETTPVLEAASLQADLRRAVNELPEIETVATVHAQRYAGVPLFKVETIGVERLLEPI